MFLFACCLSPIDGVQAANGRVESNEDVADLQNLGERQKRAAVTPLGKRLTTKLVAELGTRPRHLYSFGIGKRSISNAEMQEFLEEEAQKEAEEKHTNDEVEETSKQNSQDSLHDDEGIEKRNPYSFGLGKRSEA